MPKCSRQAPKRPRRHVILKASSDVGLRFRNTDMKVSTEIATPPKSTRSRNSDFSVFRGINQNQDFGLNWICTEELECLDLVDFGVVAFSVEIVIHTQRVWLSSLLARLVTASKCYHPDINQIQNFFETQIPRYKFNLNQNLKFHVSHCFRRHIWDAYGE
jgi:hypothetical protein